ncbi:MAG: hypothetical protein COB98_07965 [Flavobacteriaceae bacterium]|nr:MAG: hypothetical protein COB98_07965 [Flavobacteriaceae bacterium]
MGFNNYEEDLPSLKKLISLKTNIAVNGKYLYNKTREYEKGQNPIKLNREYTFIYFQTLGYIDVHDFMEQVSLKKANQEEQLDLEKNRLDHHYEDEYYVGYFFGEKNEIINTKLIISKATAKVIWVLAYWELENKQSEYVYNGHINYQEGNMSFYFKSTENNLNRSAFIALACDERVKIMNFLRGAYCGYDWNGNPVVGEILFQRVQSREEQNKHSVNRNINPAICQYINGKRWVIPTKMLYSVYDLSTKSKFAQLMENYKKTFQVFFITMENGIHTMQLSILDNSGNAQLKIKGHALYKGVFEISSSGQMLIGQFKNTNTDLPLSIFINTNPIDTDAYTGSLVGVSQLDKCFNGKIYAFTNTKENPNFSSETSEINSALLKDIPAIVLTDYKKMFKNNPIKKYLLKTTVKEPVNYIKRFLGDFKLLFLNDKKEAQEAVLIIKENGCVDLNYKHLYYEGSYTLTEGAVLSIYLTVCNGIPHCGHLMIKINEQFDAYKDCYKGSWQYLDSAFNPMVSEVVMLPLKNTSLEKKIYKLLMND